MTSNVSSDNKNTKTKLEELESKFEGNMKCEVEVQLIKAIISRPIIKSKHIYISSVNKKTREMTC